MAVQTVKSLLEKAKDENKDPHFTMLEARNTPVDNYRSPAELAVGRQLRSVLPVNPNNLKTKTIDDDEFKERRRKDKEKQSKYYDQHTKVMKELRYGKAVKMLRDGKMFFLVETFSTALEKVDEPRSCILKMGNGITYRKNRSRILKTQVDKHNVIEISDDDDEEETSEENVTVQSDDTLKDVKLEESEVNEKNERDDANGTIEPEKITRSGRVSRRPYVDYENYEDYDHF